MCGDNRQRAPRSAGVVGRDAGRFSRNWIDNPIERAKYFALLTRMAVWIATAAFAAVDRELEDAARSMGASPLHAFLTVTLPKSVRKSLAKTAAEHGTTPERLVALVLSEWLDH